MRGTADEPQLPVGLVDPGLMRDAGEGILQMHETMEEQGLPRPRDDTREHEVWVTLCNGEGADRGQCDVERREQGPERGEFGADRREPDADRGELTEVERRLVDALGERPRRDKLRIAILALLRRRPYKPAALAALAALAAVLGGRNVRRPAEQHLGPMVEAGLLRRTIPQRPTDPNQGCYAADGYQGPVAEGPGSGE